MPVPESWIREIPGADATSPEHIYEASLRLVAAGLSVIPIDAYHGSKSPDVQRLPRANDWHNGQARKSWSIYTIRRPKHEELSRWYSQGGQYGLAVVGGTVSGGTYGFGLEVIDIDTADLAKPWIDRVEQKAPG
jgi:hypothetical protein